MDIASGLSAKLGVPVVSSCRNFTADGKFVSQICGGRLMVEGDLPTPTTLVTMIPRRNIKLNTDRAPRLLQ